MPITPRDLAYWLRRRLRAFLWKQWKRGTVRFDAYFASLGIPQLFGTQSLNPPNRRIRDPSVRVV